jgi:hypothetical protein
MKKQHLLHFFLLVFSTVSLVSCDNEPIDSALNLADFGDDVINPTETFFRADFSGATWTAEDIEVYVSPNSIRIAATRGTQEEGFAFFLLDNTEGNYPGNENLLTFTPAGSEFGYWSYNPDDPDENTGSITITDIDTVNETISGFFNFKGYWSNDFVNNILPIVFSNGSFQNLPYVTESPTADTFYAKVGGVEFVDTDITALELTVGSVNLISINARDINDNAITVAVNDNLGLGTHPITTTSTNNTQANYKFNNVVNNAQTGSITIISKTPSRIKGTFSFVTPGPTSYTISEGQFDVAY